LRLIEQELNDVPGRGKRIWKTSPI